MIIDTSASMIVPQEIDNKSKKKDEAEDVKPVEESSESNNSKLDFNKDEAATVRGRAEIKSTGDIYSDKGELQGKPAIRQNIPNENVNIDIFV